MGGTLRLVAACLLVSAAAACSQTDSKDLRTSGIGATIRVNAEADGANGIDVSATLGTGGLNSVDLTGADALTVTAGGRTRTLQHHEAFSQDDYRTHLDLDGPARGDLPVTVGLRRGAGDESAPASTVRLPAELRVTAPKAGSTHRRSADLIVTTSSLGTDGQAGLKYEGSCIVPGSIPAGPGPLIIRAGEMQPASASAAPSGSASPSAVPASCAVTLEITSQREGQLDDHFEDGHIFALRTTKIAIYSTP